MRCLLTVSPGLGVGQTPGVHLELSVQQVDGADTVVQLHRHRLLLVRVVLAVVHHGLVGLHGDLRELDLILGYRGEDLVVELPHPEHGHYGWSHQVVRVPGPAPALDLQGIQEPFTMSYSSKTEESLQKHNICS